MLGGIYHHGEAAESGKYRVWWPESGGIRILLEVALVYHLVAVATPVLTEQVGLLNPAIVPEPFTTALYVLLWIGIGAVVAWLVLSESLLSIHQLDEHETIEERFEFEGHDQRWLLTNGGMVVLGGTLTLVTYEGFVSVFLHVVDLLVVVVDEFSWAITIVDGLYVGGFLGGFLLFATGVDRLVVAGSRKYVRRQYRSR